MPARFLGKAKDGQFQVFQFENIKNYEVIVLYLNRPKGKGPLLLRINSSCITSDVFGDVGRCDCKIQLDNAMDLMAKSDNGMIIYSMNEEGMGNGIFNKINSYHLMENENLSSRQAYEKMGFTADNRDYFYVCTILKYYSINDVILLTNNPKKMKALTKNNIRVQKRPLVTKSRKLKNYLISKVLDFGHDI
ncbi:MAG: GTP cyclohydrolase [Bdellovibrionota bacterium]